MQYRWKPYVRCTKQWIYVQAIYDDVILKDMIEKDMILGDANLPDVILDDVILSKQRDPVHLVLKDKIRVSLRRPPDMMKDSILTARGEK